MFDYPMTPRRIANRLFLEWSWYYDDEWLREYYADGFSFYSQFIETPAAGDTEANTNK